MNPAQNLGVVEPLEGLKNVMASRSGTHGTGEQLVLAKFLPGIEGIRENTCLG